MIDLYDFYKPLTLSILKHRKQTGPTGRTHTMKSDKAQKTPN